MKAIPTIEGYLHQIRSSLHLDPGTEGTVVGELVTYFEEKTAELEDEEGLDPQQAEREAVLSLGPARDLARLMYAAHSRGTWLDVLLACQPHLVFAALCATHLWRRPMICAGLYLITLFVSYSAWRSGRPPWAFPWIGYAFAPLLAGGVFCHALVANAARGLFTGAVAGETQPAAGVTLLLVALCAAGLWLFLAMAARVLRRDWLLLSVSTLPWPVLALWLLHLEGEAHVAADAAAVPPILLLAGTAALFLRLRARLHKGGVLAVGGVAATLIMTVTVEGDGSFALLMRVSALALAVLFAPVLLAAFRRGRALSGPEQAPQESRPGG